MEKEEIITLGFFFYEKECKETKINAKKNILFLFYAIMKIISIVVSGE